MKVILDQKSRGIIYNHTNFFINFDKAADIDCTLLDMASQLLDAPASKVYVLTSEESCIKRFSDELYGERRDLLFQKDPEKEACELELIDQQLFDLTQKISAASEGMSIFTIQKKTEAGVNAAVQNLLTEITSDLECFESPILLITSDVIEMLNDRKDILSNILSSFYMLRRCLFDKSSKNKNRLTVLAGAIPHSRDDNDPSDANTDVGSIKFCSMLDYTTLIYNADNAACLDIAGQWHVSDTAIGEKKYAQLATVNTATISPAAMVYEETCPIKWFKNRE